MNQVDCIILSSDRMTCTVHLVNGPSIHFNFFKMRMTYTEFLDWFSEVTNVSIRKSA